MAKIDSANIPAVQFTEQTAAPATPATGKWKLYHKSDGLYTLDDTGTETGPLGTGGGGDVTPDTPPATPNAMNDEFDAANGSAIGSKWTLWSGASSGTVAAEYHQGGAYIMRGPASSTFQRVYTQPISSSTFAFQARVRLCDNESSTAAYDAANFADLTAIGLFCGTTSDNKWWFGGMQWTSGVPRFVLKYGTGTTHNGQAGYWGEPDLVNAAMLSSRGVWLEMYYSPTGIQLFLSLSGHPGTFHLVSGVALPNGHLSTNPTHVGFGQMNNGDAKVKIGIYDWFRRSL